MANAAYASRLRFLDANDVHDDVVDYDGLDVIGADGDTIGNLDGFIVDAEAGRLYHLVIDSGGWFRSRQFLVPAGHARIAATRRALIVDVTKDAVSRFPEFHPDRFRTFTDHDLRAFEQRTATACCPDEPIDDVSVTTWGYDTRRHYAQPEWWRYRARHEHLRPIETLTRPRAVATAAAPVRELHERDLRERDLRERDLRERELVTARGEERDYSPHLDGRAQPGDVLGIETGGERTHVGETAEDENKRRRAAERGARDEERPPRSDR